MAVPHTAGANPARLRRVLGLPDAVVIGLGSMIGAGVFAALAPAAAAAGAGVLWALVIAAVVAYCNATSTARLAARYPVSGGVYVYGRERLGPFWGFLAGWGFVVGKTASCAAMALTVGLYAWPEHAHAVAVGAVIAVTVLDYTGVHRTALATRVIVAVVSAVLAAVVVAALVAPTPAAVQAVAPVEVSIPGVLQAAGLLFFAFAGYARIATLGEEVRDPARTIPRAIPIALGLTLIVYTAVALAALRMLGSGGLAAAPDPLAAVVRAAGAPFLEPVVRIGAALAALGALLALLLGVSRTMLAMARDRRLPGALAAVHPRRQVPHRAGLLIGAVVAVVAATADIRGAIGFSSFAVLVYYAIANIAAWTLPAESGRASRVIAAVGLAGCLILAAALPPLAVGTGAVVLAAGAVVFAVQHRLDRRRPAGG